MKQKDTYKEVTTLSYSNATVRVHIPDISESERQRRMDKIGECAARLLLSKK